MLAALSVLAVGAEADWANFHEGPGSRLLFAIGGDFVAANGRRAMWLMTLPRWARIPLSLIGGIVRYLWAGWFFSRAARLMAVTS